MRVVETGFLKGSTMRHVLRMTLTGAAGITFVFLVDAANLFWISRIGDTRLVAAMGFVFAIQFFSVSFGIGLMISATAIISRFIGLGRRDLAREHVSSLILLAFIFQLAVATVIALFRHELVELNGAKGYTALLAERYLLTTIFSLPIMVIGMMGSAALRADGQAIKAMTVTLFPGGLAMLVDPILIIWLELKLDGAAIALWISRIAMASVALFFLISKNDFLGKPSLKTICSSIRPFFRIAIPAILSQLAAPFGNYAVTTVVSGFGDSAVAAWAVINRLTIVAFGGIFSLSGALGGIFGQNYGADNFQRLRRIYIDGLLFCFGYTSIVWIVLISARDLVVIGFKINMEGLDILDAFISVGVISFAFTGMMFVATAAFNNLDRPIWSTFVNWIRDGVLIYPFSFFLSGMFAAPGVIYAQALVAVLAGITTAIWGFLFIRRMALY